MIITDSATYCPQVLLGCMISLTLLTSRGIGFDALTYRGIAVGPATLHAAENPSVADLG